MENFDDLQNLRENQILEQEGSYYVYIYSKVGVTEEKAELEKAADLEELIITYMTYAKRNSQAKRIYGMIVDSTAGNYGNHSILFEGSEKTNVVNKTRFSDMSVNKNDVPILILIENGRVAKQYVTEKDIREELDKMNS